MATYTDDQGNTYASIQLTWDANAELDLANYVVGWSRDNSDWQETRADSAATSCRIDGLACGASYYFRIKAVDKAGNESAWANFNSGSPITMSSDATAPDNPTGLTAYSRFKSVHLEWTNPAQKDLDHIEVWRNSSASWTGATKLAEIKTNSYTDEIGLWDSTFYYALKAVDTTGNTSSGTAWVSGNTDITAPDAPTNLASSTGTVEDADGHIIPYIDLTWTDSATEDVQAHEVEIWYDLDGDASYADESPTTFRVLGSPLRISPAPGNVDYQVRVRALDDAQLPSAWTGYDSGTTAKDNTAPTNPANVAATAGKKSVVITWDDPGDADWAYTVVKCDTSNPPTTVVARVRTTSFTYETANYSVHRAKVQHVDTSGNVSDESGMVSATPLQVGGSGGSGFTDIEDASIDTADIANLAVTTAKIDNLAVTDAKIDTLSAGKISAGTITAQVSLQSAGTIGFVDGPSMSGSGGLLQIVGNVKAGDLLPVATDTYNIGTGSLTWNTMTINIISFLTTLQVGAIVIVDSSRNLKSVTIDAATVTVDAEWNINQIIDVNAVEIDGTQVITNTPQLANCTIDAATVSLDANWDIGSHNLRARTLQSDAVTGTAPLAVLSTTKVTNLNADLLDGYHASISNVVSTCVVRNAAGDIDVHDIVCYGISCNNILPDTDNTYYCGSAAKRWAYVYCTNLVEGDHIFEERECAICGRPFRRGQNLVYHVISVGDEGTRTIPAHEGCAGTPVD